MLAKRIIPTILKKGDAMVKGKRFSSWRSVGHAMQACAIHAARGVDELILLDIAATPEERTPDFAAVGRLTANLFSPLTVGGGVRTIEHIEQLLKNGADKVAICTAAWDFDRVFVKEAAQHFGSQAIVVGIDINAGMLVTHCSRHTTEIGGLYSPAMCAKHAEDLGAGEILLTSVERDGCMEGYDTDLISAVSRAVSIPVIAAGGAGTYQHMLEAIEAGADAVAASSMFLFTEATPKGAAAYLAAHGVEVRV